MRRALMFTIIVCMLASATPGVADSTLASSRSSTLESRSVIVLYKDQLMSSSDFSALASLGVAPDDVSVRRPELALVAVPDGISASALAARLTSMPGVAAAAPAGRVQALETVPPNDTKYSTQRKVLGPNDLFPHSIAVEPVWDAEYGDSEFSLEPDRAGVTVAVIDSGVSASAMEDSGRIVPVHNYVANNGNTTDDYYPYFHGTRVASALGSQIGNGYAVAGSLGYTRSTIRVYKTLDRTGNGESIDTMNALMAAANDGVKVANVSLGEPATISGSFTPDPQARALWQGVVDYCAAKGMLVVAAAGNGADLVSSSPYYPGVWYPAACEGALAVGSIHPDTGARSIFSSYGDELDVVAPGEQVVVAGPTGTTYTVRGTSFASPLVAGALATLWSMVPSLNATEMARIAISTADASYNTPGFDSETGWGRLDALSAFSEMTSTIPSQLPVTVSASPQGGLQALLSWSPAEGANVRYRYGVLGGPEYSGTSTSGRVLLPAGGTQTVWVRAFADDRFDASMSTTSVIADPSIRALDASRHQGTDRYETAAAISRSSFTGPVNTIVIASGQNWPDGLSASVLAKAGSGPLLLTRQGSLPAATRDELLRLAPARIIVVGGTQAISAAVETTLRSLQYPRSPVIERMGGADRYSTAALIAGRVKSLNGGVAPERVVISSGSNYPDALSVAPLAAASGWPILLTAPEGLPWPTANAITSLGSRKSLIVGGTQAIFASV
ncbi:MAG: S8 family serine peptidase, partial [Coriobacteriia bacterium]|nr:S8 family serine peptidase [Coriobacteriia bacterium]